ncbi:MAG: hypothetical protein K2Y23_00145 [Cyanobacteria bacterium]|nr:hypothetical protein [Cyanobacteriota bacterium]
MIDAIDLTRTFGATLAADHLNLGVAILMTRTICSVPGNPARLSVS